MLRLASVSVLRTVTVTGAPPLTVLRLAWNVASADSRPTNPVTGATALICSLPSTALAAVSLSAPPALAAVWLAPKPICVIAGLPPAAVSEKEVTPGRPPSTTWVSWRPARICDPSPAAVRAALMSSTRSSTVEFVLVPAALPSVLDLAMVTATGAWPFTARLNVASPDSWP